MTIYYQKHITRQDVQNHFPNRVYIFGDNMERRGLGGLAQQVRGEPNAIGIPTKHAPNMGDRAFFSDDDLDIPDIKNSIDFGFDMAFAWLNAGGDVVIPKAGIGTGLAQLETKAPKIFAYIKRRLKELEFFATEIKEI